MQFPDLSGARCSEVGLEWFYPEEGGSGTNLYKEARKICNRCEVKDKCLEWGLKHEDWGMWGGLTPHERDALRRSKKIRLQEILTRDYV